MYSSESENRFLPSKPLKLKPHTVSKFAIIVPYFGSSSVSLGQIMYDSPLFNIWCALVACFIIARVIIKSCPPFKRNLNELVYIPFNTIGASFGTTSAENVRSSSENLIVLLIGISSLFTGTFCSGILLQSFVESTSIPFINSLYDLEKYPTLRFASNQFAYFLELGEWEKNWPQ